MRKLLDDFASSHLIRIHIIIFMVFTFFYARMDLKTHFDTNQQNFAYLSTVVHTGLGFGDITPKTHTAKMLVTVHAITSFLSTLLVISRR